MNDNAILLQGVRKAFAGHVAVDELSLEVPAGQRLRPARPQRAGKTTTLRMVMNILGPDPAPIEILGRPADHAARDRIGYMPEERGLYPAHGPRASSSSSWPRSRARAGPTPGRVGPWLAAGPRQGLADKKTNELSKGMQQKAQFIATVLHEPDVLILDEPMSGLDPWAWT